MDVLPTQVDTASEDFRANQAHHIGLRDELRGVLGRVREGGSERARARHERRGKLFVRERIDRLLEPSPRGDGIAYIPFDPRARATMSLAGPKPAGSRSGSLMREFGRPRSILD